MPVESADDLAGFFDPDEFGEAMTIQMSLEAIEFAGIYTESPLTEEHGMRTGITGAVPRIIASRSAIADVTQGDVITRQDGREYIVNEVQVKDRLLIIHVHDNW